MSKNKKSRDGYGFHAKVISNVHTSGYEYETKSPYELFKKANELLDEYHYKINKIRRDGYALMRLVLLSIEFSNKLYQIFGTSFENYDSFIKDEATLNEFDKLLLAYDFKYVDAYIYVWDKHTNLAKEQPGKIKYHTSALSLIQAISKMHICQLRYNDFIGFVTDLTRIDSYIGNVGCDMIAYRNKVTDDLKKANENFKSAMKVFNADKLPFNSGMSRAIILQALSFLSMAAVPSDVFRSFYMPNNRTMLYMMVSLPDVDEKIYLPHDDHTLGAKRIEDDDPHVHTFSCFWLKN